MYIRYGKMQTGDYLVAWIEMVILLLLGVTSLIFQPGSWFGALLIVIPIFWCLGVFRAFRERFTLETDQIVIGSGENEKRIALPRELVIVLSEMDMHEKMGSFSIGAEKQYYATLAADVTGGEVWQTLHRKKMKKYAASVIDGKLGLDYVYSFVCDRALLRQVIKDRNCYVILPASLKPIFFEMLSARENVEVRVDPYY